jgi:HK97 family phage major capsid protein
MASREDAQGHAEMLLDTIDDETGTLAHRFLKTGSPLYERAWSKAVAAGTPQLLSGEEYRALSLGTDGSGGYAVPFQLDPSVILTSAGVINPLRDISRVEQIVGKEWMGVVSAGVSVSRAAEAAEASDNSFTLTQPTVRTNRVQGFIPFSYELAESWAQVRNEITRALVDAKGREEANSFMNGDGTGLNAGGVIGTLSGGSLVAATSGQAFTAADVYHLEESLDPRWRTPDAKFIAHRAIYNKIRQFDQYGGAQLWQRIGAGMPAELLGYSALESSVMDSTHATGDLFLLFGNFQQFLIVDRIGMSVELIPQVFGANQRPTGQRGIYAIWMNNSAVLVPGAFKALQGTA